MASFRRELCTTIEKICLWLLTNGRHQAMLLICRMMNAGLCCVWHSAEDAVISLLLDYRYRDVLAEVWQDIWHCFLVETILTK